MMMKINQISKKTKSHGKIVLGATLALILGGVLIIPSSVEAFSFKSLRTKDAAVKKEYLKDRENYAQTKNAYSEARRDYLQVKNDLQAYRAGELQNLSLDQAKDYFIKVTQGMIKYLTLSKNKIVNMSGLSEEQKNNLIAEINDDIAWLESKQSEIKAATDRTQLREIATQVRKYWSNHRAKVKAVVGRALGYKINLALTKLDTIGQRVSNAIDKLKNAGKDTAELEKLYTQFSTHLDQAKTDYQLAQDKFKQVNDLRSGDSLLREAHEYLKQANQQLRLAHQNLVTIVKEMKS